MNNYYYSQHYYTYENSIIGHSWGRPLTMGKQGCLITASAMLISYFNDKPLYPDQYLTWLLNNGGLTKGGNMAWSAITNATGGKLRCSSKPDAKSGELTYCLRQVRWGLSTHWVLDHPTERGKIIDPWNGDVKPYYHEHKYTGRNYYFIGKR